jgi:hypothetical protein
MKSPTEAMTMDKATCTLCGEPMPAGEEMFKYHGLSGPCPKPPLPRPSIEAMIEYIHREADGQYWLDIQCNGILWEQFGPFETTAERQRAHDDMLNTMRHFGAKDVPLLPQ